MRILALDTTLSACSVALLADSEIIGFETARIARGHAEALLPMVMQVCAQAEKTLADIDRIAVTVGPGTFVGIRVGVAAARAFGLALDIPVTGVTTLEALAATAGPDTGPIAAVIDARNNQYYAQLFDGENRPADKPQLLQTEALITLVSDAAASLTGPGADALAAAIAARSSYRPPIISALTPDARIIARLATGREAQAPNTIRPLYLRPPDAKLPHARTPRSIA